MQDNNIKVAGRVRIAPEYAARHQNADGRDDLRQPRQGLFEGAAMPVFKGKSVKSR